VKKVGVKERIPDVTGIGLTFFLQHRALQPLNPLARHQ